MSVREKLKAFKPAHFMAAAFIITVLEVLLEGIDVLPAGNGVTVLFGSLVIALILTEWVHPRK